VFAGPQGLNQPLQVSKGRLEWKDGLRFASLTDVEGFGATWSDRSRSRSSDDGTAKWISTSRESLGRRRPRSWMDHAPGRLATTLAPSLLGGDTANPAASELLQRVNAEGYLSVDEFTWRASSWSRCERARFARFAFGVAVKRSSLRRREY